MKSRPVSAILRSKIDAVDDILRKKIRMIPESGRMTQELLTLSPGLIRNEDGEDISLFEKSS
jgi:hypothetical protein